MASVICKSCRKNITWDGTEWVQPALDSVQKAEYVLGKDGNLYYLKKQADVTLQYCLWISMLTSLLQSAHTNQVCVRRGQCATNVTGTSLSGAQYFSFVFARLQFPIPTDTKSCCVWLLCVSSHKCWAGASAPATASSFYIFFLFIIH